MFKEIKILVLTAVLGLGTISNANADNHFYRSPERHAHHSSINPWPFIAGAVIGGIIVHEADQPPKVITSNVVEPPVLVNGIWMQRTLRCVQEIVTDYRGDQSIVNRCNYVYVPVPTLTQPQGN